MAIKSKNSTKKGFLKANSEESSERDESHGLEIHNMESRLHRLVRIQSVDWWNIQSERRARSVRKKTPRKKEN